MNDDALKLAWQHQRVALPTRATDPAMLERVKRMSRKFEAKLFWRDVREIGACAIVIALTAGGLVGDASALTRAGNVVVILSCAFIALTLLVARHGRGRAADAPSIREGLVAEAARVSRQIWLLRNVLWWYVVPPLLGVALAEVGYRQSGWVKAIVLLLLVVAGWLVYRLNRRAVHRLSDAISHIDQALDALREFSGQ